jgi:hypothetical protein
VKNGIRGIGETIIDDSATFGTSRLEGFANFRNFVNYPADVHERIPGNNDSTMTLVAHETAHRWGASIKFDSDPSSRVKVSSALLGRGMAHWCYFANLSSTFNASTSSSLEGNGWADLGTGIFQTTNAQGTGGYSEIDQYLMGFRLPTEVGSTFVIDEDRSVTQSCSDKPYTPEIDGPSPITVTGSRLDLSVDDIIRVEGQRIPDASQSPRKIRMAFMLLTRDVPTVPSGDIAKLNGIRQEFTSYFLQESDNRGEAVTALGPVDMDGDGVDSLTDCNDLDPLVNPDAIEGPAFQESCNMIDDDCDGFVDEGFDADGDLWTTCNGDCDDTNADVSPDGIEVIGDLVDNDCDTLIESWWTGSTTTATGSSIAPTPRSRRSPRRARAAPTASTTTATTSSTVDLKARSPAAGSAQFEFTGAAPGAAPFFWADRPSPVLSMASPIREGRLSLPPPLVSPRGSRALTEMPGRGASRSRDPGAPRGPERGRERLKGTGMAVYSGQRYKQGRNIQ